MKVISIKAEELLDAVSDATEPYPVNTAENIKVDTAAFLHRYAQEAYVFGIDREDRHTEWIQMSYHMALGEILIILRNNHVEEEFVFLSDLDKALDKYVSIDPYL